MIDIVGGDGKPTATGRVVKTYPPTPFESLPAEVRNSAIIIMIIALVTLVGVSVLLGFGTGTQVSPGAAPVNGGVVPSFAGNSTEPSTSPTDTATPQTTNDAGTEAGVINGLLQQASSDHAQVASAVSDLTACGSTSGISTDISTLDQAASARSQVANDVGRTDVGQITNGQQLQQQFVAALNDSAQADQAFSAWGTDLSGNCTSTADINDSHYKDGMSYSSRASTDKASLVATWNPIAQTYGLTTWSASDL